MKITKLIIFFFVVLGCHSPVLSQDQQGTTKDSTLKNLKISAFPVAFYTPETAFGFGGLGIATFWLKDEARETRPSSVQFGLSYTTKGQFLVYVPFEFYRDNERWRLLGELGFYKYYYNFYGTGIDAPEENEESYEVTFPRVRLSLLREIIPNFSVGLAYEFDGFSNLKIEEGGTLESSDVVGKRDGSVSNIGLSIIYDTRDNIFFPTKGFYLQGKAFTSSKLLGSSFTYSKFELDNRFYQKVGKDQVIATNLFLGSSSEGTPFYDLYYLGSKRTRGINNRRFQDNTELSFALEYRFPIAGRFGGAVFGATGTVAPNLGETFSTTFKNTGGVGLRYILNKRDGVRIRADFGMSNEGGQFYFTIKEAF
ncbi:BamA/TamA family outer membrane protein [Pareuzebyella sediminis]|uniref:BamA/TamA family outer membrane protein n=1 Tax=Pareuzebyella sediminis TaxID=2607998 RepID=UPI0011ECC6D8|nr:BamA/TamA family outer membrane protein [Pareuzebyella sediminis]